MTDLEQRLRRWRQVPVEALRDLQEAADTLSAVKEIAANFDGYNGDDLISEIRLALEDKP